MKEAAAAVCAAALIGGGCGAGMADTSRADARVERCVERLLSRGGSEADTGSARRYVAETYCRPFESRSWIYDDGTLAIRAHVWAMESGSEDCEVATAGGRSRDVPCDQLERDASRIVLDCALLHHVRRGEAQAYLAKLRSEAEVECDDGTALDDLGAR